MNNGIWCIRTGLACRTLNTVAQRNIVLIRLHAVDRWLFGSEVLQGRCFSVHRVLCVLLSGLEDISCVFRRTQLAQTLYYMVNTFLSQLLVTRSVISIISSVYFCLIPVNFDASIANTVFVFYIISSYFTLNSLS